MASDIKLHDGSNRDWVSIEANVLNVTGDEIRLHGTGEQDGQRRRAVVRNDDDGLTINVDGDYPGGVRLVDALVNVRVHRQHNGAPELPPDGAAGDLLLVVNELSGGGLRQAGRDTALWVCLGPNPDRMVPVTEWAKLAVSETVDVKP